MFLASALFCVLPAANADANPKSKATSKPTSKQDWANAFTADAALQIRDPLRGVAVVAAGADAGDAAAALAASLRAAGFKTVDVPMSMQGDPRKNDHDICRDLDKAGIRAGSTAVVRVYPGVKGRRKTAVVLQYDRSLALVSSLVGEEGGGADASRPQALAEEQYARQVLWYGTYLMPEPGTIAVDDTFNIIFQGTQSSRRAVGWGEFYRLVGRPDLSAKYRTRMQLSYGAVAAGTIGLVVVLLSGDFEEMLPLAGVSTAALIGGGLGIQFANPASRGEARRMIEEHNSKLRVRLGLAVRDGALDPEVALAVRF